MLLKEIAPQYKGSINPEVSTITADSRRVVDGSLFAALPGLKMDGNDYIEAAIQKGAVAILASASANVPAHIAHIISDNPRHDLAFIAYKFYGAVPENIVAVTGTNGKSSTVFFVQQLWESLGLKSASLGTVGIFGTGLSQAGSLTTPDPIFLHKTLSDLKLAGYEHLAFEASSIGIEQSRIDALPIKAAAFTNLTLDHLDYHHTMDAYLEAKMKLFTDRLLPDGVAVIYADMPESESITARIKQKVIRYGTKGDIFVKKRTPKPTGQDLIISVIGREYEVHLPLVGAFQAMNALCALALVVGEDVTNTTRTESLIEGLASLRGAPGRLQFIEGPNGAAIYVDYAHTPDALENAIQALRPHTHNRLISVFGCGGDRDKTKRGLMGKISSDQADISIVTDDNPRTEDPLQIRSEILSTMNPSAIEIGDRREAILRAVEMLQAGDVLLIAGKGHEQGQTIGNVVEPFDDVAEAVRAIELLVNR
jgi:UDP-N-acetylmuramoyl-L-alanyl-D-glutamate--2,6-diaminopimelate ligase